MIRDIFGRNQNAQIDDESDEESEDDDEFGDDEVDIIIIDPHTDTDSGYETDYEHWHNW